MQRLSDETWKNIFKNLAELNEEVEITWLDYVPPEKEEWVLNSGEELFEDGFKSEEEAQARLAELENRLL